jgi:glycosyltransferase involved in cell wall biosynthesis
MNTHYAYQRLMSELATGRERFDVLHSHALHYLPVAMAELVDTPMLLTLHTPPTPWLESALQAAGPRGPRLAAVSQATARMWRGCAKDAAVVPNGIDLEFWRPGPGGPALAWTGRIVPEKAPHLALDAARAAALPIRIAGPIVDRRYFDAEVAPRLHRGARYIGHVRHDGLHALLCDSAALLQTPVWDEPFGLTAAEAIGTGTPVVSFARGGLPEVIGRQGGLLVAPGDVDGLAAAAHAARELSRSRIRRHAERTLSIDRMGRAYERLYRELAGASPVDDDDDDAPDAEVLAGVAA